jgi:phosphoribosylamine--glycine ligase
MRILVLGSGAREHALCWRLGLDAGVSHVRCAPGNPGLAQSVDVAPVVPTDAGAVIDLVARDRIDLTVIGPEAPLAAGLADRLIASGHPVFGPTRAAARLEASKAFAKDFMARHGVPTARYRICRSAEDALTVIRRGELGEAVVVKADGLAAGKGVVVAPTRAAAEAAVQAAMVEQAFGDAGACVVLEECLSGPEVSCFVVADGEAYVPLLTAQDHKRIFDHDEGPNTGGMGAFAPSPLVDAALQVRIEREIVRPVLSGLVAEGTPFCGFLYCGLMITADGPKVIEFNVRFGDPEAQVVLPLLDEPLAPLLMAAAQGRLGSRVSGDATGAHAAGPAPVAVGVVLAAHGYPGPVRTGDRIDGLEHLAHEYPDVLAFYAGVAAAEGGLATAGGRVMTLVARAATYEEAIARVYDAAGCVRFAGLHFRRDIGAKALVTRSTAP